MIKAAARQLHIPDSYDAYETDDELNLVAEKYVTEVLKYTTVSETRSYGRDVYFISPDKMVVVRKTEKQRRV